MVIYKVLDGAGSPGRLVLIHLATVFCHKRVQLRDNPPIQFAAFLIRENLLLVNGPAIEIGIQRKEVVGIVECSEQLVARFNNTLKVELQVIPRRCIRHHIPAGGIGAMGSEGFKRIHHIPLRFGHFVALLVEHQSVRHYVFIGNRIETHHGDGVKGIKPATGLVNALRNKIGREVTPERFLIFKRVMPLRVRHGTGIEPDVNQVQFPAHGPAGGRNQYHLINVGAVQVGWRLLIQSELCVGLFDTGTQLFHRADTNLFFSVFRAPHRQRYAPVAGAGEVPVLQVFQPLPEATASGTFRLPVDGFIQFGHALFGGGCPDKPGVERVIEHGLVGTPAVRVVVCVFFNFERLVVFFQAQCNKQIGGFELLVGSNLFRVIFRFHIAASELFAQFRNKATLAIYQRKRQIRIFLIWNTDHRNTGIARHAHVVCTEVRGRMYHAGTVFCSYKIARNHPEGARLQFRACNIWK